METALRVTEALKSFRETRLSGIRAPTEFFDHHRVSRPADFNQATQRISYNTKYFSGNYGLIVAALAVYAVLTNPLLLIAMGFLFGGFAAISKFAPESVEIAGTVITQKSLYITLFVIGIPLLWISSPISTFFWIIGASGVLIFGHACLMEPGIESEYAAVQDAV